MNSFRPLCQGTSASCEDTKCLLEVWRKHRHTTKWQEQAAMEEFPRDAEGLLVAQSLQPPEQTSLFVPSLCCPYPGSDWPLFLLFLATLSL
ncbi:hypothetical protein ACRRTK_011891 [Alexandromys fortis]